MSAVTWLSVGYLVGISVTVLGTLARAAALSRRLRREDEECEPIPERRPRRCL